MDSELKKQILRTIICVAIGVAMLLMLAGCSAEVVARAEAYWPKENKDNVWRSRAEFHRKSSQTAENMGAFYK